MTLSELLSALVLGFAAGITDFSLAVGYDLVVVPMLILLGVDVCTAISTALLAQILASAAYGLFMRKSIARRRGIAVVVCSGLSAAALSLFSATVWKCIARSAVIAVLLLTSATCTYSALRGRDPLRSARRGLIAPFALLAGAVKGLSGCGFSAVMMLGQLTLGIGLSSAVATTVISKIVPAAMALVPRIGFSAPSLPLALSIFLGSIAAIPLARKILANVPRRVTYAAIAIYSAVVSTVMML